MRRACCLWADLPYSKACLAVVLQRFPTLFEIDLSRRRIFRAPGRTNGTGIRLGACSSQLRKPCDAAIHTLRVSFWGDLGEFPLKFSGIDENVCDRGKGCGAASWRVRQLATADVDIIRYQFQECNDAPLTSAKTCARDGAGAKQITNIFIAFCKLPRFQVYRIEARLDLNNQRQHSRRAAPQIAP